MSRGIWGVGTDIISVPRVQALLEAGEQRFLARWFTDAEARYCMARANPPQHLAARLAAKESVVKALRMDSGGPVPWRGIEVVPAADGRGGPRVRIDDAVLAQSGIGPACAIHLSMSHCTEYATAVVVAEALAG